jgi:hypothetical protein
MQSIHLVLGRSNLLAQFFSILHAGACTMLLWAWIGDNLDIELIWLCITIIFLSWHNCLTKHAFKTDLNAVQELIYMPLTRCWQIKFVNGKEIFANLCADSVLILGISLLKFKQEGYFLCKPILISQDTIGKEDFRLLRKWWRQHGQSSTSV